MIRRSDLGLGAAAMVGLLLVLAACGTSGAKPAARTQPDRVAVTSSPTPTVSVSATPGYTGPRFDSPEAAMRYLAAAWNRHDVAALKHVTTPEGRAALTGMYDEAVNLRLDYCQARSGMGDYDCHFIHDYPARLHKKGEGHAEFIAGPARNPGWYMTVFVGCG
ncbi:MAG: hypothetical protein QOD07_531 [Frankiaceae bacterium]|jgi:hypothetical protein|nr:hypothetical protein [Frankiaceae bacterium]